MTTSEKFTLIEKWLSSNNIYYVEYSILGPIHSFFHESRSRIKSLQNQILLRQQTRISQATI